MAGQNMDQLRQVDVPTLLSSIAQQLSQTQDQLNSVDNKGTHGQRMATAFNAAAEAAHNSGSNDAGVQLQAAAQAMRQQSTGKAASFYADGLEHAAADFKGQQSISSANLLPFLQSFLGGVESNNPARPGQGTMLDAIHPAVNALNQAEKAGQPIEAGLLQSLSAAITGTQGTAGNQGTVDPGAASATNVIGGIITALAPSLITMLFNKGDNTSNYATQPQGGLAGDLGTLLGGLTGSQSQSQSQQQSGGSVDLGGLLSGLMGSNQSQLDDQQQGAGGNVDIGGLLGGLMGSQSGGQQSGGSMDWVGGLLGGLLGGSQPNSAQQNPQGGLGDLGGLLGGLMGGQTNNDQ